LSVAAAIRPLSRSLTVHSGKGATQTEAVVSAVMEALECHRAESDNLPTVELTLAEARRRWPAVCHDLPRLRGRRLMARRRIPWMAAQDLMGGPATLVPWECVSADYRLPLRSGTGIFVRTTAGLAAHPNRSTALLHGLCEVVERDAFSLWNLRPVKEQTATQIDLATVLSRSLARNLAAAGILPVLYEITSDIRIPTFVCRLGDAGTSRHSPFGMTTGLGCHPDRRRAAFRALAEAAQSRVVAIAGARDDLKPWHYAVMSLGLDAIARPGAARLPAWTPSEPVFAGAARLRWTPRRPAADLRGALRALRDVGLDRCLVVALDGEDLPVSVVRVIVPGAEGPHHRVAHEPGPRARRVLAES